MMAQLFDLYTTFCYFGLICLSGGGSLLPFYIDELVEKRGWMTIEELGNFMAISQVTPGPIGINMATFIGHTQMGILGGLVSTIALLTPSFILMSLALKSYERFSGSKLVRGIMYGIKPVTVSLLFTAMMACLGMSVLTRPLSFDWLFCKGKELAPLSVHLWALPPFVFSVWMLSTKKLGIMTVIFSSAAYGIAVGLIKLKFGV